MNNLRERTNTFNYDVQSQRGFERLSDRTKSCYIGLWGMTALTAAELNFQNPSPSNPQWLALAQAVFNQLASRWESDVCGGGLRWQVYFWNDAWPYKNAISNGCLFNMGARLARYTGNNSYALWAEKTWDWITAINFIQFQPYINGSGAGGYVIWDGASTTVNCSVINRIPFSYNAGIWLWGAATMYNYVSLYSKIIRRYTRSN